VVGLVHHRDRVTWVSPRCCFSASAGLPSRTSSAPQTRALAKGACFDCHSNETKWPWYTNAAPVSWLVENDVKGGRSAFDFSEWDRPQDVGVDDIVEAVRGGGMPPWYYAWMPNHPDARLSKSEKDALIAGLRKTLAASPPIGGGG